MQLLKFNGPYYINNDHWHTYCNIRLGHPSDWPSLDTCPLCNMPIADDQAINHALSCAVNKGEKTRLHNRMVLKIVDLLRTTRPGLVTHEYENQTLWSHNPDNLRPDFATLTYDLQNQCIGTAYDFTAHSATCKTNLDRTKARIPEALGGEGLMPPTAIIDYFDNQKREKYTATARLNSFQFQPLAFELNGGFSKKTSAILKKWSQRHPDGLVFADILHCELARCCATLHQNYFNHVSRVQQDILPTGCFSTTHSPNYVADTSPNPPTLCVLPGCTSVLPVVS